jgi:CBS domain-containing protein
MVMLTEVLRFDIIDEQNRRAKVSDLCIALLEDDYPPVTHVLFSQEGELRQIDWTEVLSLDRKRRQFRVRDLSSAGPAADDKDVFLRRDIMDALVLDLMNARTTRVCDLLLEEEDGALRVKAADAGMAAMLRRVTRGHFGRVNKKLLFDWKYVEFLRGDPQAVRNGAGYRLRINRLPAGEIARLADYIPYLHAAELVKLLPDDKAADVLEAMSVERQLQVIEELDEREAVNILSLMSSDLATDLIGHLQVDTMRRYVSMMPEKPRNRVIELLRYPENSVGGVMINDMICLPAGLTGAEAKQELQKRLKAVDFTSVIFLVDDEESRKLRGAALLRDLLTVGAEQTIEDIMDPYLKVLDPFDDAGDAAYKIVNGQLSAMPVVNPEGRLLGAMTIDAAIARLIPATSNLQTLRVFS